jgi:hypothetical protein
LIENLARLLQEVIGAVAHAAGPDHTGVCLSPKGKLQGASHRSRSAAGGQQSFLVVDVERRNTGGTGCRVDPNRSIREKVRSGFLAHAIVHHEDRAFCKALRAFEP